MRPSGSTCCGAPPGPARRTGDTSCGRWTRTLPQAGSRRLSTAPACSAGRPVPCLRVMTRTCGAGVLGVRRTGTTMTSRLARTMRRGVVGVRHRSARLRVGEIRTAPRVRELGRRVREFKVVLRIRRGRRVAPARVMCRRTGGVRVMARVQRRGGRAVMAGRPAWVASRRVGECKAVLLGGRRMVMAGRLVRVVSCRAGEIRVVLLGGRRMVVAGGLVRVVSCRAGEIRVVPRVLRAGMAGRRARAVSRRVGEIREVPRVR
ncbi:hypothetical protein ATK36_1268 [Amycolatopsis sulphurea]|uniref:Uncharacterized protein n=1 Tax=Amycolatopsis sulphurea TaxID=76022 RepID=A0A2A9F556_9PSEU|nr:hypothetical protein ATK36_1268 [Amycolatopsis sulphurea]